MFLDTSVLVRYLTGDPPDMARRAALVIDDGRQLLINDVVLAETAYVLSSVYGVDRRRVVDVLLDLIAKENIGLWLMDEVRVTEALLLCRESNRLSFADSLLWATARSSPTPVVCTFDERFPRDGLKVHVPE